MVNSNHFPQFNPLSPSIHMQILQTDLYNYISLKNK